MQAKACEDRAIVIVLCFVYKIDKKIVELKMSKYYCVPKPNSGACGAICTKLCTSVCTNLSSFMRVRL